MLILAHARVGQGHDCAPRRQDVGPPDAGRDRTAEPCAAPTGAAAPSSGQAARAFQSHRGNRCLLQSIPSIGRAPGAAARWALLGAALVLGWLPAAGAAEVAAGTTAVEAPARSRFTAVGGEVTLIRGSSRSAAVRGEEVREGDILLTGASGHAALALRDGTQLALSADSRVEITQFRYDATSGDHALLLSLRRGVMAVAAAPEAVAKAQLKVITPTAVVTGHDANFIVEQTP